MPEEPTSEGQFDVSEYFTLVSAPKPPPRPPSDDDNLYGEGWIARRTPEGCRLSWITNHPVAHVMSAEATATITEADFERLRDDPDCAPDVILKYEPTQVIEGDS